MTARLGARDGQELINPSHRVKHTMGLAKYLMEVWDLPVCERVNSSYLHTVPRCILGIDCSTAAVR